MDLGRYDGPQKCSPANDRRIEWRPSRRQWSHGLVVSLINARPEGKHFYSQPDCSSLTDWRIEQIYVVISKVKEMLMGHVDGLSEKRSLRDQLLPDRESELEDDDNEAASTSEQILYTASFEELARNSIQYDTIIWFSISLLLVLAWGVGLIMLLYLPLRRYVLQKDISSRKLYVTQSHVVYKISRPSFIPFWGVITIEKQVPLSMVIDIIIEQGWLQSLYGIHTFRIESIACGKSTPVDELQVQGVANPGLLRKVIITEASKVMQDVGIRRNPAPLAEEGENFSRMGSPTERPLIFKSPSKSLKMSGSPRYSPMDLRGIIPENLVLNKLEEVNRSVKKIESLMEKSQPSPKSKAVKQLKFGH